MAHNGRVIGGFREGHRRECYMKRRGNYLCNRYELHCGVELYSLEESPGWLVRELPHHSQLFLRQSRPPKERNRLATTHFAVAICIGEGEPMPVVRHRRRCGDALLST